MDIPEPADGAGVADSDPDQSGVSQDPDVVIIGDVDQLPEEPASPEVVNDIDDSERGA
jgi:hypothetical protein